MKHTISIYICVLYVEARIIVLSTYNPSGREKEKEKDRQMDRRANYVLLTEDICN